MRMTPPSLLAILALCPLIIPSRADAPASDHARQDPYLAMKMSESLMSMLPIPEIYEEGMGYPATFKDKATTWTKIFEVPSSWLIPLGYVESKYQPMATNKSGATGATQIKLARAKDLVTWLGRSKWRTHQKVQEILAMFWHGLRNDLLNLDLNIMLAAFELHHLRRRFGNDREIVHAAYNQGEGRISRCLERGLPLPARAIEFIARVERARQRGCT